MLIVMITGMLVLLLDVITPPERKGINVFLSIVGVALSGVASAALWDKGYSSFGGSIVADNFALLFQIILLVVVAMSVLLSEKYIEIKGINHGEYYALMLLSASGAMLMAASRELITIFIGLEILSIALYVLSGFARTEPRSEESAMKYFLL